MSVAPKKLWKPSASRVQSSHIFNFIQFIKKHNKYNKQIDKIDGFLIGGASKSSKNFIDIIKNYYR